MMKDPDGRLVYSTDIALNQKCLACKELVSECLCERKQEVCPSTFVANLRMEKTGRGGKTVTVIDELPKNELFLKDLTSELKKKCGAGGTYLIKAKHACIEIQGDKRDSIRIFLAQKGIRTKG